MLLFVEYVFTAVLIWKLIQCYIGRVVTRSSMERAEVWGSNFEPVKSDTVLPTARHRGNISSKEFLSGRNDTELGSENSLHASS